MERPWLKFYEPGVPHHIQYPDIPLYRVLDNAVRDFPENEAIVFRGRKITYRQLGEEVASVASGLAQRGLKKGQRMAIMLPNCPQYVATYYAILKIGGIVVNVSPMYVERELEFQLKDAGVETILALRDFYPRLETVRKTVSMETIILTDLHETGGERPGQKKETATAKGGLRLHGAA
jgi:long-chain acyl-CoA synthetase